jgi:PAS domain S-box-containing protein
MAELNAAHKLESNARRIPRRIAPFIGVLISLLLVTLFRHALSPVLGVKALYLLYFLPVAFSAWRWGTWPAVLAMILGGIGGTAVAGLPWSVLLQAPGVWLNLGLFFIVSGWLTVAINNERKARGALEQAQRQTRRSEAMAKLLLDGVPGPALLLKPDGTIVQVNRIAAAEFKSSVDRMTGTCLYDYLEAQLSARRRERIEDVLRTKAPVHFEEEIYGRQITGFLHPVMDEGGNVKFLAVFGLDLTEQKAAETELKREREFLAMALSHARAGVWQWDISTGKLEWSPEIFDLLMWDGTETVSYENFLRAIDPRDRQKMDEHTQQSVQTGVPFDIRFRIRRGDGAERWIHSRGKTSVDKCGRAERMAGVAMDVTEREIREQSLRASEESYRLLVETACEGIWVLDAEGCTTFVNAKMASMLGYTTGEMMGRHLFTFMNEAGQRIAAENLERRRQGIAEQHDFCFTRKDDSEMWAVVNTNPIFGANGAYDGTLGMITDITERHRVQKALAESERHYRLLFETMAQGVVRLDAEGRVASINPSGERILGRKREDIVGSTKFMERPDSLNEDGTPLKVEESPGIWPSAPESRL